MLWKKKTTIKNQNDDLAMKMAVMADRDFIFSGDEETHDRNIMAIAEVAHLLERIENLEKSKR